MPEKHIDGIQTVGFRTYSLKDDVEKAKSLVTEGLKEEVAFRYEKMILMNQLIKENPK